MMKSIIQAVVAFWAVLLLPLVSVAGETAYSALRTVSSLRGEHTIKGLVQLSGIQGVPQPLVWRIVVADSTARGGLREFEVSGGNILSERTPVRPSKMGATLPINVASLNVDSDGAFLAAVEQAKRMQIGFDSANYTLASRDALGAPFWKVELVGADGSVLATIEISAKDGVVLNALSGATQAQANQQEDRLGGFLGRTSDALGSAGKATQRTLLKGAGAVQEWLTGRRTIGQEPSE